MLMEFRGRREMPVDSERSRSIREKVLESSTRSKEVSQSVLNFQAVQGAEAGGEV